MDLDSVATEQVWKQRGQHSRWKVVALSDDGLVALTGPLPGRAVLYVSVDELLTTWQLVDE